MMRSCVIQTIRNLRGSVTTPPFPKSLLTCLVIISRKKGAAGRASAGGTNENGSHRKRGVIPVCAAPGRVAACVGHSRLESGQNIPSRVHLPDKRCPTLGVRLILPGQKSHGMRKRTFDLRVPQHASRRGQVCARTEAGRLAVRPQLEYRCQFYTGSRRERRRRIMSFIVATLSAVTFQTR